MHLLLRMIISLLWRISIVAASPSDKVSPIAKSDCKTRCGNVSIPYPFGIGPSSNCYLYNGFEIDCNNSTSGPRPFLKHTNIEVLDISVEGTIRVKHPVMFFNRNKVPQLPNFTGSPFLYSQERNQFTAVSCGFFALVRSYRDQSVVGGCMSTCDKSAETRQNHGCVGINCCQTTLPRYLSVIDAVIKPQSEEDTSNGKGRVVADNYAFLVEQQWFHYILSNFRDVEDMDSGPVVLDWSISLDDMTSSLVKLYKEHDIKRSTLFVQVKEYHQSRNVDPTPYCMTYNITSPAYNQSRLQCFCPDGFEGSPYLLQPCQDIDECNGPYPCPAHDNISKWNLGGSDICENTFGGHTCHSNTTGLLCEYYGTSDVLCHYLSDEKSKWPIKIVLLGLVTSLGIMLIVVGSWHVYKVIKKRRKNKRKEMFFKRNGGLLLEQKLSSGEKFKVEKIKLFKSKELEKSTDNFNINRIVGHGGQGTVYKGMLTDGRIVAVKKSEVVGEGKLSQFINEVVLLSQINHRNVVKLLGCCLETEVPILVYEFIPNGTLSQYIQGNAEDCQFPWKMRLRVATKVAGALSYLHSAACFPIFHRDIKSSNILLDEKCRAKVADFGTSRSISIDHTHLTTLVNGTFGYLDPEYFQSNRFTEKSDVYSFGVVLAELLTGRKPVCSMSKSQEEEDYISLAMYFITSMHEDRLLDIVDARIMKDVSETEIRVVANLARRCLHLNGRNRPTMREVTTELEAIQNLRKNLCCSNKLFNGLTCPK